MTLIRACACAMLAIGLSLVSATTTSTARLTSTDWQPTACGGGSLQFSLAAGIISGLALGVVLTPPLSANATILGISLAVVKWCTRESPATVDVAVQFGDSRELISRNVKRSDPWPKSPTQIRYGNATDNWQVTDTARFAQAMLRLEGVSAVADTCTVQLECRALNVTWSLPATTTRVTTMVPPTTMVSLTAPMMTTTPAPPTMTNHPTATSAAPVPSMTTTAAVMTAPVWSTAAETAPVETAPTTPVITTTIAPLEPWSTDYGQPPINISLVAGLAVIAALLVIGAIAICGALVWRTHVSRMRKNSTPNSRQTAAVQTVYGSIPNARPPAAAAAPPTIQYEQWPAVEVTHYYGLESGSDSRTSYASIELSPASTARPASNSRPAHYLHFWQNRQSAN